MRYFATPNLERREAEIIPQQFGKVYAPAGPVSIGASSILERKGTDFVILRGELLAIHPDSGAWAFLTPEEAKLLSMIDRTPYGQLDGSWPGLEPFIASLWRRGLISINGYRAVDEAMFEDSPNFHEGHLIELLLTEKCNLACGYCLAGANPNMPTMTPEIARRTVDLAFGMSEARVLGFEFSGGEPFLKFGLMRQLVAYIQSHPLRNGRRVFLSVQSNGTLLTAERVQWLKDNQVSIGISLDGQPWSQNVSRPMLNGTQSFQQLLRGIDLLQRAQVPFGALVVLNRSNVGSVHELIDFCLDNDITSFKLNPVSFLGTAQQNWDNVGLTQEEVVEYFIQLIALIGNRGYPLMEANVYTMLQFLTSKQRTTRCLRSHCGAGDTFQAISAAGDIYPCGRSTQTPALKLGNVLDVALASLSAPARHNPYIEEIRSRRPSNLEGCPDCEYRQFCQAGCSAQAFEKYGTVRHHTPECHFFKTLYPHLMYELSFSPAMFKVFERIGYFGKDGVLIHDEYGSATRTSVAVA
jgi:uncharacterized protein